MSDMRGITREVAGGVGRAGGGQYRSVALTRDGAVFTADWLRSLATEGRIYVASDAAVTDTVTGQTGFANTTPTFVLDVPSGTTAIPLNLELVQDGSVAGNIVHAVIEIDNASRVTSGTVEAIVLSTRTDNPQAAKSALYSTVTAPAGRGTTLASYVMGQDVSPAEGAANGIFWTPKVPLLLVGPAAFLVFTWAGTTGPTWDWSLAWAEIPSTDLTA